MKVSGTIDRRSYLSIGKYMLSTGYNIAFIAVMAVLVLGLISLPILLKDLVWLLIPLMLALGGVSFYRWNRKNVINRVIASTPGIREGKSFDLDISLDEDAVRVHNRATGLDTALSYELFSSYVQTDQVLALFVKTGTYLLIPTITLPEAQKTEVLSQLRAHCPRLRQRRL